MLQQSTGGTPDPVAVTSQLEQVRAGEYGKRDIWL